MDQFIGHQSAAEDPQSCVESAQAPQYPERLIRQGMFTFWDFMVLHELGQQARLPLFFGDEQVEDFHERMIGLQFAGAAHGPPQLRAIGALTQLEGGDGCAA